MCVTHAVGPETRLLLSFIHVSRSSPALPQLARLMGHSELKKEPQRLLCGSLVLRTEYPHFAILELGAQLKKTPSLVAHCLFCAGGTNGF